jgi:hypothetical protein
VTIESLPEIRLRPTPSPRLRVAISYPPHPHGSPVVASLIAGFAIYVPMPIVRGALFGLMPGIAWRSWRLAGFGALCGVFAEFVHMFFFRLLLDGWNTREVYCELLLTHLPPGIMTLAIPDFHPLPNSVHFVIIIVIWAAVMFPMWYVAWPCPKCGRDVCILVPVVIAAATASAVWLWCTAPPGPYERSVNSVRNEAEIMRFLATNFIFAFSPACALLGWTIAKLTLPLSVPPVAEPTSPAPTGPKPVGRP